MQRKFNKTLTRRPSSSLGMNEEHSRVKQYQVQVQILKEIILYSQHPPYLNQFLLNSPVVQDYRTIARHVCHCDRWNNLMTLTNTNLFGTLFEAEV